MKTNQIISTLGCLTLIILAIYFVTGLLKIGGDGLSTLGSKYDLNMIEGFANKTATQFVEALPEFHKFLEESNLTKNKIMTLKPNKEDKSPNKTKPPISGPLVGEVIVLSDFKQDGVNKTKKEFTSQLEDLGAIIENSLTKKTTILIVGSKDVETGKIKKAKTQPNTKILTFNEFNNKYL